MPTPEDEKMRLEELRFAKKQQWSIATAADGATRALGKSDWVNFSHPHWVFWVPTFIFSPKAFSRHSACDRR
jgi:hypothetical protein